MGKPNTRQQILTAAIDLFAEKGFANVSIRELADRVGIRSASLYYHFENKNDILRVIINTYHLQLFSIHTYPNMDTLIAEMAPMSYDEVVSQLFLLNLQDPLQAMKMARITLREQFSNTRAAQFWQGRAVEQTVDWWRQLLDVMVADGRLPPMDTTMAAEISVRVFITCVFEMAGAADLKDTLPGTQASQLLSEVFGRIKKGKLL